MWEFLKLRRLEIIKSSLDRSSSAIRLILLIVKFFLGQNESNEIWSRTGALIVKLKIRIREIVKNYRINGRTWCSLNFRKKFLRRTSQIINYKSRNVSSVSIIIVVVWEVLVAGLVIVLIIRIVIVVVVIEVVIVIIVAVVISVVIVIVLIVTVVVVVVVVVITVAAALTKVIIIVAVIKWILVHNRWWKNYSI